jgi:glycosyltransferase involved in cell wall biosynthesis
MACGSAVVAYDIDCLREIVGAGSGVLVKPFDTRAYANAALRVLSDPADQILRGEQGRLVAGAYDWNALCTAQEAVYERAAGGGCAR